MRCHAAVIASAHGQVAWIFRRRFRPPRTRRPAECSTRYRSVLGSALARSPSRARSLSQASRICPVIAAVSHAALIPKSKDVISSRLRAVFDVHDGAFLLGIVRGGRGYLAPSITEMTGVFGARAACGDAVGCGVVDGAWGRRGSGRAGGPVPGFPELGGEVAEHGEVVCP